MVPSKTSFMVKSAGVMMVATLVSRVLGLFRDMIIAAFFGATAQYDAFLVAYTIPNLLRRLLAEGALSAAFVPVFTRRIVKGEQTEAWDTVNSLINIMIVLFIIIVSAGEFFAPWLVKLIAPGFGESTHLLAVKLTRVMFPFIVFMSLAAISMGILNALGKFFVPALAPAMLNISIISIMLLFGKVRWAILLLAVAVMVGGGLQFFVQLPLLYKKGYRYRFVLDLHNPDVLQIGRLMLPYVFGLAVTQLDIVIDRILASMLTSGSISVLNYALRLVLLPMGVFGIAISTAVFPTLSKHSAQDSPSEFVDALTDGLAFVSFIVVPAAIGLAVLGKPIIRLLFARGEFGAWAVESTSFVLYFYAAGLPFMAYLNLILKAFYAAYDTKTPVKVGAFMVGLNFVLAYSLMHVLDVGGLAFATSVVSAINFAVLFEILRRRFDFLRWGAFLFPLLRVLGVGAVMLVVVYVLGVYWIEDCYGWILLVKLSVTVLLGMFVFLLLLYLLKVRERRYISVVYELFMQRLRG